MTVGVENSIVGMRAFYGISDLNAALSNLSPFTDNTLSKTGLAIESNTGNWSAVFGASGATPTVIDLGTDFTFTSAEMLQVDVYALPNPSTITLSIKNLASGIIRTINAGNLILGTTYMAPTAWICNNATANAIAMNLGRIEWHSPN
jgi:hypothetical protein